ncbi:hypothetical protein ACTXT7_001198 [Hymenolepis weldensis]
MTIYRETKRLKGKFSKAEKCPPLPPPHSPHDLSQINEQQRVTSCVSQRSRELQAPKFRYRIITDSDEKWWFFHNNVKRKRQSRLSRGSKPIPQPG